MHSRFENNRVVPTLDGLEEIVSYLKESPKNDGLEEIVNFIAKKETTTREA